MKSTKDSKKIILTTKRLYYMLLTYKTKNDFFFFPSTIERSRFSTASHLSSIP